MNAPRIYKQATIFNCRATGFKHLWEPSTSYQGKPQQTPSYLFSLIVPKTRGHWSEETQFAGFTAAAQELYQQTLTHIPFPQIVWPIKDGDLPPEHGKPPIEWCRNHWFVTGSSSTPIETNIVQNGVPVKIANRAIVKPGDFCAVGLALAVKTNMPNGVKCYINSVLFLAPGEEIAVGNSISGTELMAQAKAQGLNVTGFGAGTPGSGFGGGFGAPQQGFTQPAQAGFAPVAGFAPQGAPGQTPQQTAAFPSNGGFPGQPRAPSGFGGAPAPMQPPQGQFATPGGFTAPQGFPQR